MTNDLSLKEIAHSVRALLVVVEGFQAVIETQLNYSATAEQTYDLHDAQTKTLKLTRVYIDRAEQHLNVAVAKLADISSSNSD